MSYVSNSSLEHRVDQVAHMLTEAEQTLLSLTFADAPQRRVWESKVSILNQLFREVYGQWVRRQLELPR